MTLGRPSVYEGRPKFEIENENRCLQKSKLVDLGGQPSPLAPALLWVITGEANQSIAIHRLIFACVAVDREPIWHLHDGFGHQHSQFK